MESEDRQRRHRRLGTAGAPAEQPRVFLGVLEVSGYFANLRDGFDALGIHAELVSLAEHPHQYSGSGAPDHALVRWTRTAAAQRRTAGSVAARVAWAAPEAFLRLGLFMWAARRFDAFIYGFGSSITGFAHPEYQLLRWLGRRIISVFMGSDTRPPYMDGALVAGMEGHEVERCIALAAQAKARARTADRLAHWVVTNPASAHFQERLAISGYSLGVPMTARVSGERIERAESPVRILHCPSHPEAKGTARIVAAIEALRARGHLIELVLVTGRSHADVLAELARSDLVVDQLYSDTPMAVFAAEAASYGVPAIVGGYAEEVFQRYIPPEVRAPSFYCHPDQIETAIERLVVYPALRRTLGARAKAFVEREWTQRRVAERYLRLLGHDVPASWIFDPNEIRYVYGSGIPAERVRELIRGMVAKAGRRSLQVFDKPALEKYLLEVCGCDVDGRPPSPLRAVLEDNGLESESERQERLQTAVREPGV